MAGHAKLLDPQLLIRRCVNCGYEGSLLKGGQASRCARCGCDLHKRPARSYAEMEGLVNKLDSGRGSCPSFPEEERLVHRWLTFLFFGMIGLILIAWLSSEALSAV